MKKLLILLLVLALLSGAVVGGLYLLEKAGVWDALAQKIAGMIEQALPPELDAGDDENNGNGNNDGNGDNDEDDEDNDPYDEDRTTVQVDDVLQNRLLQAIRDGKTEVDITDLKYDAVRLKEQVSRFLFTHPELFFVDSNYRYYTKEQGGVVTTLEFTYLYTPAQIEEMTAFYDGAVDGIVAGIPAGASDFDKVLYLHDYLVQNYAYDYEGLKATPIRDAYNFFKTGRGVCQAYMLAMIALCEKAGIPCLPVTSEAMEHAWNLVKLDGKWYHVDVTWDDAGGEESAVYPSYVSYKYFLLSGEALYNGGRRAQWSASEKANDTLYDAAVWRGTTTKMVSRGERYYCALFDIEAKTTKLYGGTPTQMEPVLTLEDAKWYGDPGKYYLTAWAGLAARGEKLLVSTATAFFFYDVQTGVLTQVADLKAELGDKQIFGICDTDGAGNVRYVVAKDYDGSYEVESRKIPLP